VRKRFVPLANGRATGRAMDDRNGSTALLLALSKIDPAKLANQVTFVWAVEEETGLAGAVLVANEFVPHTVFAVDTFVSSDAPLDPQRVAGAKLGSGAVLRGLDSRTLVQPGIIDRIAGIAKARKIALQIGVTSGGTDASAFSAHGAIDVGLSWPGRYSHSPVEVMDRRDLESLVNLIVALSLDY
jgi:putative aminopeptidase FrvX